MGAAACMVRGGRRLAGWVLDVFSCRFERWSRRYWKGTAWGIVDTITSLTEHWLPSINAPARTHGHAHAHAHAHACMNGYIYMRSRSKGAYACLRSCRYNHSGVTALRFEADWSGLINLDKAECVVEVEVSDLM